MADIIKANDGTNATTTPQLVLGWNTGRRSRNILHSIIGGGVAVALIAPDPRRGTLSLLYATEAAAIAAVTLHAKVTSFTLTSTDRAAANMTYVLADGGEVRLMLDDATRSVWTVDVPYQEVIA